MADLVALLRLCGDLSGYRKLAVIYPAHLESSEVVASLFLLTGRWAAVRILRAASGVRDNRGSLHSLPAEFEGPVVQGAVDACLGSLHIRDEALYLGDECCIVLRELGVPESTLRSFAAFALTVQHAVPFVFALEGGSRIVTQRFFAVMPRARMVSLDAGLPRRDLVWLDAVLRLRTTIIGYLTFDCEAGRAATVPFSFLSRPVTPRQAEYFAVKWRFNVSQHGGDPSALAAVAALDPPSETNGPPGNIACLVQSSSSSSFVDFFSREKTKKGANGETAECNFECPSCAEHRHVTDDFLTLALNRVLFGSDTLLSRLERIANHLIGRLLLARELSAAGNTTVPIVPVWGSLMVPKDFGYWLNLMQDNSEVAVGRYIVVLNRADERLHRFMCLLQARVSSAVGSDLALVYEYRPENLGIADGWNLIGSLSFDHPTLPSVDWIVVMNNDISLRPGVLKEFAGETEGLKRLVATHNLLGFASFAITKLGWLHTGRFDSNLWPAYATDVEYLLRIKSRGLLRADYGALDGDVFHVESVALRDNIVEDVIFKEWVGRWERAEYVFRKWAVELHTPALQTGQVHVEDYPVNPYPYGIRSMPHKASGCLEPAHRQCLRTYSGSHYDESLQCFFNVTNLVRHCGVPEKEIRWWWNVTKLFVNNLANAEYFNFSQAVVIYAAPALRAGQSAKDAILLAQVEAEEEVVVVEERKTRREEEAMNASSSSMQPLSDQSNRTNSSTRLSDVPHFGARPSPRVNRTAKKSEKVAIKEKSSSSSSSSPASRGSAPCFIPVLVLVAFREVDALYHFLSKQKCAIGTLVIRGVGPNSRLRHLLFTFSSELVLLLDPNRTRTVQSSGILRSTNKRAFIPDVFDFGLLSKNITSVGAGFRDAMLAVVFDDVFGRVRNMSQDGDPELDPPSADGSALAVDPCASASSNSWKRWVLFVDVEQQLTDVAALTRLARWMALQTSGITREQCRNKGLVLLAADNFFAASISVLRRAPLFPAKWGFQDVGAALAASAVERLGNNNVIVDRLQFATVSTVSGYAARPFEPFSDPPPAWWFP